ncbi:L-threonate dehydrogenase [Cupriavidus neocaledonicus]|uniref:L-threonate dehydrogenase n=1 Tax=Cupriavidus neocaledonicus TaxID=1040979 RepID=A0A375H6L3_9BURK|nr:L-threonate dehydrogenase [Cupriavidus neocaledonicus]SOZ34700.1 putative 3-hydroxyisobutyrate dehydrogenase; putative exported protein [Cupriavidus neocaledonicus]SPD46526.1 putative dehydrogenase, with NAD(P)-binding Rossmann-fold domain [Cupriavidus neocaledonicus]
MSRNIGVIGLGAMGFGVAQSLLRAGFNVHACDLRAEVLQRFADAGGVPCASPAELGRRCDVVLTLVVNAQQTEAVLFGADGAVAAMQPGKLVIASATVPPGFAGTLGQRLAEKGLLMLDAPVSGGAARAASGEMTMMTSGPAEAYALAEDVLAAIAGKVYRLGAAHGAGSKVKIINQLLAGVHIAAAAEAMALGLREGVDPDALYDVITHSAGNSWMFENRVPHILKGDYTPLSAVDIFVKDLGMVLDTARTSKFPLPLSAAAHQMFMMASTAGHGGEDDSAVIKIFPGIELPGQAE